MTYGSVCSGIEAATVAWHPLGMRPLWFAEIEPFPSAVLAHHYPDVPNYGDFTALLDKPPAWVDVLVGGTPCQAFSVAGLREGLADPRGALTEAFFKLASVMRPRFIVWENVPGVLSIDGGKVFSDILSYLEEIGYVVDADVLDAQFFGLAQRRQRVFLVCQDIADIRQQRTTSSGLVLAQCLTEISALVLAGARGQSQTGPRSSAPGSGGAVDSVRRRIRLFGLEDADHRATWRESLAAILPSSACGLGASGSISGGADMADTRTPTTDTPFAGLWQERAGASPSIAPSWPNILDALWPIMSAFTTSTSTSAISESEIFTCAQTTLSTAWRIGLSKDSSPRFWTAASSASTAMLEFTNYASSFCRGLFAETRWVREWDHFLREAVRCHHALGGAGDWSRPPPLLSLAEGVRRDSPPRRETGAGVAGSVGAGADGRGWRVGADEAAAGHAIPVDLQNTRIGGDVAGTVDCSRPGRGGGQAVMHVAGLDGGELARSLTAHPARLDYETETLIAHTLRGELFEEMMDGPRFRTHFQTCPTAKKHRKPAKPKEVHQ